MPRVLFESVLIAFSVLLALALDEWRQDRERVERAALALEAVQTELAMNRRSMEDARVFHLATRDTLRSYVADRAVPPESFYYYRGMFKPAWVVSTAWQSARETGATQDMPYDLVLAFSRIYARQAKYEALGDHIVAAMQDDLRRSGPDVVLRDGFASFITLTEDFSNRERVLLEEYDSTFAIFDRVRR